MYMYGLLFYERRHLFAKCFVNWLLVVKDETKPWLHITHKNPLQVDCRYKYGVLHIKSCRK